MTPARQPAKRNIGIWTELPGGAGLRAEGLARLLAFIVEGAAQRNDIMFHLVVDVESHEPWRAMLKSLQAKEGVDWTVWSNQFRYNPFRRAGEWVLRTITRPLRLLFRKGLLRASSPASRDAAGEAGRRSRRLALRLGTFGHSLQTWAELRAGSQRKHPSLVDFANDKVKVDGWLLWRPDALNGVGLKGRRIVVFPDAIPVDFAASYAPGQWNEWADKVRQTLPRVDGLIAYSRHVAERHLGGFFGVEAARITVIAHAPPDLAGDLPPLASGRRRTPASHKYAAELLRRHAAARGWSYLLGFPFEDVNYVAMSTQDRANKNLPLAVEAVRQLNRRDYFGVKLFTTAVLHENEPGCMLPDALREARLALDFVSMPDLPKPEHAAFYHCAAVTVHPSLFEGGATVFPFSESVSLGTPCLMARGPHTEELLESHPELEPWVFDPYDADALAGLIRATIADREHVLAAQIKSFERMRARTWAQVAGEYADVAAGKCKAAARNDRDMMS